MTDEREDSEAKPADASADASAKKNEADAPDSETTSSAGDEAPSSEAKDEAGSDNEDKGSDKDPLEGGKTVAVPMPSPEELEKKAAEARSASDGAKGGARAMIEARGLSKFYGDFAAIQDVSFEIPAGQVVAFLGPNGAGKSTTMKILTGYLSPSAGSARIAGLDVARDRIAAARHIGYMPENGPLYVDMTPRSLLEFFGSARGYAGSELADRVAEVVRQCHLEQVIEKPISKLSRGYRQRVGMAQAFLHSPDVLILDEPTSGLDPNEIRKVRENIRALGEQKTILLSTHILQEVEAMASRVIFIHDGRIVFDGDKAALRERGSNLDDCFAALTGAA